MSTQDYSVASASGTLRPLMRLALPVLVEQTLLMLVGLVDTWLTGNYLRDDAFLAAIGLVAYVMWLIPSMFASVAIGATAMVSRCVGRGDLPNASRVANQAILVGVLLAFLVTTIFYLFAERFVALMQLQEDAATLAARYLFIIVPVIPAMMIEQVGIASLRGAGDTLSGFVAMTIVNAINVTVSTILVLGNQSDPYSAWQGLALGTALGHVVGALIILGLLMRGRAGLRLRRSQLRPDASIIRSLIRIGLPGGIDVLAILSCHLWFVSIINRLGTSPAAAHSLAVRIESLAYLPGTAFQVAAATMTGQLLGANRPGQATRSVFTACGVGGGVMSLAALIMFFYAEPLTTFFLGTADLKGSAGEAASQTAETAQHLLRLVAFAIPSFAVTMVLTGALRGAGDTRWPLLITLIGFLGIRIPLAYYFSSHELRFPPAEFVIFGVYGAWCAMVIDVVVRSFLVTWRFLQGGWTRVKI